jgi:hypothetical protein
MNKKFLLLLFLLLLSSLACNAVLPQAVPATQSVPFLDQPTTALPGPSGGTGTVPLSEAGVPRISVDEAKAAFDSGQAIIIDVRSPDAYADSHAEGAINIPLGIFESDIENVQLLKDQWIITYCT